MVYAASVRAALGSP